MAGTATSWKTSNIAYKEGQLWGKLAIPGASARITLDADGTPDATANATAYHYGATKSGAKLMIKSTLLNQNVDEFRAPIATNIDAISMGISAELVGVTDLNLITNLLPGVGTFATATGYEQVRVGTTPIAYQSVACIFPLIENTTKFGIFNVYSALNDSGVEWAQARKELGFAPVNFVGYEITSRAATDTLGSFWKQIA